jgi:hypothetical protein
MSRLKPQTVLLVSFERGLQVRPCTCETVTTDWLTNGRIYFLNISTANLNNFLLQNEFLKRTENAFGVKSTPAIPNLGNTWNYMGSTHDSLATALWMASNTKGLTFFLRSKNKLGCSQAFLRSLSASQNVNSPSSSALCTTRTKLTKHTSKYQIYSSYLKKCIKNANIPLKIEEFALKSSMLQICTYKPEKNYILCTRDG